MGKNIKCAAEANNVEPSKTMVTINKAVFLHYFHRVDVNPKHIQTDLCQKKMNKSILSSIPKIAPRVNRYRET